QTLAYCTALGLDRGMLLYPRHESPDLAAYAIRNREIVIRQVAVDLGGDPSALRAACDRLASDVFDWAAA
ncbi:MAG: restriction endonuclease, partial [Thermomicrobiales bacterium]